PLYNQSLCPRQKLIRRKGRSKTQLPLNPNFQELSGKDSQRYNLLILVEDSKVLADIPSIDASETVEELGNHPQTADTIKVIVI
ncbi:hypothetical protein Tco_0440377, partial [Tanacetum coccineum]